MGGAVQPDCRDWLWCDSGVNYTIYIFRNNTEYVNRDFHSIVGGVILYRPLYIHQVFPSSPFFFQYVVFTGVGTFICIDRRYCFSIPSQASLTFPPARSAPRGCSWTPELDSCHCDRSQLGEKKTLRTFGIRVELEMLGWFHFLKMKWKVFFFLFLFAENISVGFIFTG